MSTLTPQALISLYEQQIALLKENADLLKSEIDHVRKELKDRDTPDSVSTLREQMHHYRRQCDEISTKLKEAEAYIEQMTELIAERNHRISELLERCKELEDPASSHIRNIDNA